ncbi:MAG: PP2C family protein-serine/threonine phosphatase [Phycisphaerae bacterium]
MPTAVPESVASEPPVAVELERTLDHLAKSLEPPEFSRHVAGICSTTEELDQLRAELATLRRNHDVLKSKFSDLSEEVRSAGNLQREMLDRPLPTICGATANAVQRPAGPVSGDLCQVFRLDSHRIGILLADATGHGVPAALLTTYAKAFFCGPKSHALGASPSARLEQLNEAIAAFDLTDCQFMTAVYAVFDERTRMLRWARGGAPYPLLFRANGITTELHGSGPILGIGAEAEFEDCELQLEPGDVLMLHTDGLDFLSDPHAPRPLVTAPATTCWSESLAGAGKPPVLDQLATIIAEAASNGLLEDDISIVTLAVDPPVGQPRGESVELPTTIGPRDPQYQAGT